MQTGSSSETPIGWKSGKNTYLTEWRERGYGHREVILLQMGNQKWIEWNLPPQSTH